MNGNWFAWGQDPIAFKASYIKVVNFVRNYVGPNLAMNLAFVWAPMAGDGYPYGQDSNYINKFPMLDTNKDGVFNTLDDPYSPYYPGDQYVDWVGFSVGFFF